MCLTHNVGHVGHVTQVEKFEIICIDISEKFVERVESEILDKKITLRFQTFNKKKLDDIPNIYVYFAKISFSNPILSKAELSKNRVNKQRI